MASYLKPKHFMTLTAGLGTALYFYNTQAPSATQWQDNGNRVYAWGAGMQGQLGLGVESFSVEVPTEIEELSDKNVVKVVANGDVSAALTEDGEVFVWGKTKGGALGPFAHNLDVPAQVQFENQQFKDLAIGQTHVAAITQDGKLVTWGNPHFGKLGHVEKEKKTGMSSYKPTLYADRSEIDFVTGIDEEVVKVDCGKNHTVALGKSGAVYTWGYGNEGALGHGDLEQLNQPKKIEGFSSKDISAGGDFTLCLGEDGSLYSFGRNNDGQLGIQGADTTKAPKPTKVALSRLHTAESFHTGEDHSGLVTTKGDVFTWGYGNDGQLGHGNKNVQTTPKHLKHEGNWKLVRCGGGHTGLVNDKGELWMTGRGRDGQLGRGDSIESIAAYRTELTKNEYLQKNGFKVIDLGLGSNHSIALVSLK